MFAEQQAVCGIGGVTWLITWKSLKQVTYTHVRSALTQILILPMELNEVIKLIISVMILLFNITI